MAHAEPVSNHERWRARWILPVAFVVALLSLSGSARATLAIRVQGNRLLDAEHQPIRLLGVNFSGAEYACIQDKGIWSAPTDPAAIEAMVAWRIDAVRIPLNEDCWLGINGAPPAYSGAPYREAIHEFVQALHEAGLYVILDLHWNAPGEAQATSLQPMADADHSPEFWRSVAASFRTDPAVLFDLYSEPHDIGWECWLHGCTITPPEGTPWQAAGMQTLVDAVRSQGAAQPLLLGGIEWANDLSGWLSHLPSDPENQLVASVHVYPNNVCTTAACWSSSLTPIAERHPVVAGEIGEYDCEQQFIDQFMQWADARGVSYLAWSWNAYDCASGPSLITSPEGTPTAFGQGLYEHLHQTSPSVVNALPEPVEPPPSPPTTPTPPSQPVAPIPQPLPTEPFPAPSTATPLNATAQPTDTDATPRRNVSAVKRRHPHKVTKISPLLHCTKLRSRVARKAKPKLHCSQSRTHGRTPAKKQRQLHRDVTKRSPQTSKKQQA